MLRLSTLFRIARDAGADAIDLDPSGRPFPDRGRMAATVERHGVPIRSVWVPRPGPWSGRPERAVEGAAALVHGTGAKDLILEGPIAGDGGVPRAAVIARTEAARPLVPPGTRLIVVLRHRHLEGGRRHLVQMTAWRRLAEEWEFGIALDLGGPLDPRWEAEAAVSRLGARLTMVRLPAAIAAGPTSNGNRAAIRALAAGIDGGHLAHFAIVPVMPMWRSGSGPAVAKAYADAKRRITNRNAIVEEQRIVDAFLRPRHGQRG